MKIQFCILALLGVEGQKVSLDLGPVKQEMDYWSQWIGNPETKKRMSYVAQGLGDALNESRLRIDIHGARIWRPLMDYQKAWNDYYLVGESCDDDAFFKCVMKYHKKGEFTEDDQEILHENDLDERYWRMQYTDCASLHDCLAPANPEQSDKYREDVHDKIMDLNLDSAKRQAKVTGKKVFKQFKRAMRAYKTQVKTIAVEYAQTCNKIMKEVYGCNPECTDGFTRRIIFNPIEAAKLCECKIPIKMDMSSQYLFRSPDIELYRLMKVDTSGYDAPDFTCLSQEEGLIQMDAKAGGKANTVVANTNLLAQLKMENQVVANNNPPAGNQAAPYFMPDKSESGGAAKWIVGGAMTFFVILGVVVGAINNKRKQDVNQKEGGYKENQEKLL